MENSSKTRIVKRLLIVFIIVLAIGIVIILTATKMGFVVAYDVGDNWFWGQEDGYDTSEMNVIRRGFINQQLLVGGIMAWIGGCAILLSIHWLLKLSPNAK